MSKQQQIMSVPSEIHFPKWSFMRVIHRYESIVSSMWLLYVYTHGTFHSLHHTIPYFTLLLPCLTLPCLNVNFTFSFTTPSLFITIYHNVIVPYAVFFLFNRNKLASSSKNEHMSTITVTDSTMTRWDLNCVWACITNMHSILTVTTTNTAVSLTFFTFMRDKPELHDYSVISFSRECYQLRWVSEWLNEWIWVCCSSWNDILMSPMKIWSHT